MSGISSTERRRSARIVLTALVAASFLLVPAGLARASGPTGTLEGCVTDASTATAIAGATVQVTASDVTWVFQAITDAAGRYALSLPNHIYIVQVSHPRYVVNSTNVGVGSGETVWGNMTLTPAASRSSVLQGFVTDSVSSGPVTVGQIVATTESYVTPRYTNASPMSATGFYRIGVVPARYQLTASGVVGYAPFSFSYVNPAPGQTVWRNITLDPNPLSAWINGTVEDDSDYALIVGATITATVDGLPIAPVQSNATGEYSLHVPSGTVEITADAPGYAPSTVSVYVYSGEYSRYLYLMPLSAGIRGVVRDGYTGAPIPGARVVADPFWSSGYWDQAVTNASGSYSLALIADDFDVTLTAAGYTSMYTWAFLSTGEIAWWNVTLWPIISTLKGYLIDGGTGNHVSGLNVWAYDARSGYSVSHASDASGLFSFALPPSPAIILRVYGAPPYAGGIAYPATRAYATTWVNLTLPRLNAQLVVNVTNALTGQPIPGASVSASWYYGSNAAATNATGFGRLDVPAGFAISVGAWASGYLSWYDTVPAFTGTDSISIELYPNLAANVTVRGYVRDALTNTTMTSVLVQATGYGPSAPYDYTDGTGYFQLSIVPYPQAIRATEYGYGAAVASVDPLPGSTIWVNLSMAQDTLAPAILSFTATPSSDLGPANPATLSATVNETNMGQVALSILMLRSSTAGVGTFLSLGALDTATISLAASTPGNYTVTAPWDTRTPVGRLSDGVSSEWWPAPASYTPFQVTVSGSWDNATVPSSSSALAVFDSRTGALLYVYTYSYGYITPQEQATSTFTPSMLGYRIDLASAAIVGASTVTGSAYRVGSLTLQVSNPAPGGTYAALLEAYDAGWRYARAATLMSVVADMTPPAANAGPDQAVDQDTLVTFDGSASSDNAGIVNHTWSFYDGAWRALYGSSPSYRFLAAGVFTVTLTVRDAAGNAGTDIVRITVRDVTVPAVSITTPSESANVSGSVAVVATVSDNVGVAWVEFLVDGVVVGNVSATPYQVTVDTTGLSNGAHSIVAVAHDAAGNSASTTRHVTVFNGPSSGALPFGLSIPLLGALIAVIAAALVAVILLVRRRRRPSPPPGAPPAMEPASVPPAPPPDQVPPRSP